MAIILLLLVLPRVTLAVQGGELLCFGDGHVEPDCHDAADAGCGESEPPVPSHDPHDQHDPCVDVSTAPVSLGARVTVDAGPALVGWLDLLPPLIAPALTQGTRATCDLADESPPRFGARLFATLISPRT